MSFADSLDNVALWGAVCSYRAGGHFVFAVEHRLLFDWCCLEPWAGIRSNVSCQVFWWLWVMGWGGCEVWAHSFHHSAPVSPALIDNVWDRFAVQPVGTWLCCSAAFCPCIARVRAGSCALPCAPVPGHPWWPSPQHQALLCQHLCRGWGSAPAGSRVGRELILHKLFLGYSLGGEQRCLHLLSVMG